MAGRLVPLLAVILLVQLALPVAGQGEDDGADAVAPAQLVVGLAPGIVSNSLRESDVTGRAGKAEALTVQVGAMADALENATVPAGSTHRALALEALAYARDVAGALEPVPADIGALSRSRARCDAWLGNSTLSERAGWAGSTWPAMARLAGAATLLDALEAEAPRHVDARPLGWAAEAIRAALRPGSEVGCLPQADAVGASLTRDRAHPGENLTLVVAGGHGVARVESPLFGNHSVPVDGAAVHRLTVPEDATPGRYPVNVTLGNQTVTTNVTVHRAPSRLVIDAPLTVAPDEDVPVTVRVETPLSDHAGRGPVVIAGAASMNLTLVNGTANFTIPGPHEAGVLIIRATYPGSDVVAPDDALARVRVRDAPTTLDATTTPDEGADAGERGQASASTPAAWWLAILAAAALILLAVVAWRRRGPAPSAPVAEPTRAAPASASPPPATAPAGVVGAVAAIISWLRARGLAKASDTVREVAAKVPGAQVGLLVGPFEARRYGGIDATAEPGVIRRAIRRVRQWLGISDPAGGDAS